MFKLEGLVHGLWAEGLSFEQSSELPSLAPPPLARQSCYRRLHGLDLLVKQVAPRASCRSGVLGLRPIARTLQKTLAAPRPETLLP